MGRRLIIAALVATAGAVAFETTVQAVDVYVCHRVGALPMTTLIVDSTQVNTLHLNIHPLDRLGTCPISVKK